MRPERRTTLALLTFVSVVFLFGFFGHNHRPLGGTEGGQRSEPATTFLLLRHAEKQGGDDPHLTVAGRRRAKALIGVAAEAGVAAVYATETCRTAQTAEPLALALGLDIQVQDFGDAGLRMQHCGLDAGVRALPRELDEPLEIVREILVTHAGKTIVVVGHSNTIPAWVEALGAQPVCPGTFPLIDGQCRIPDQGEASQYDNLFVVSKRGFFGPAKLVRVRYGE